MPTTGIGRRQGAVGGGDGPDGAWAGAASLESFRRRRKKIRMISRITSTATIPIPIPIHHHGMDVEEVLVGAVTLVGLNVIALDTGPPETPIDAEGAVGV